VRRVEQQWGTAIAVDVRDPIDERVLDGCFAWFRHVDDVFSTWRDDTEIMRLATGALAVADVSSDFLTVLALAEQMRLETSGAFDATFGTRVSVASSSQPVVALDLSGVVKGWAVGQAAERLRVAGATCFSIDAGGDVYVAGAPDDGAPGWRVGIQHPTDRARVAAVLLVRDAAVATSGRYERGDHVYDPRSGRPAVDLVAATVVGADPAVADAFATAVVVLGPDEGLPWLQTRAGYEGMVITNDHTVLQTAGFERRRVS
jgi:thiamine biosynthesis lipoprotein